MGHPAFVGGKGALQVPRLPPNDTDGSGPALVPRLRRSDHFGIDPQPCRAGLKFSGRPSGPRIHGDLQCHFSLNLR
jgi:hypothetical protein